MIEHSYIMHQFFYGFKDYITDDDMKIIEDITDLLKFSPTIYENIKTYRNNYKDFILDLDYMEDCEKIKLLQKNIGDFNSIIYNFSLNIGFIRNTKIKKIDLRYRFNNYISKYKTFVDDYIEKNKKLDVEKERFILHDQEYDNRLYLELQKFL